jgi:MFS family permease
MDVSVETAVPGAMALVQPRPWLALGVVFVSQLMVSFVPAIAPVLAVSMAPTLGVGAHSVGLFSALTYVVAIIGGLLAAPWIPWLGPVRSIQLMLGAAALAAVLAAMGNLAGVLLAALALGCALGIPHPAFTSLLGRHGPQHAIGLFLSARFAAAPLGIALAAWVVPPAAAAFGERAAIAAAGGACALVAVALGRSVAALDWRDGQRPRRLDVGGAIRLVLADPAMRRLGMVCLVYAMVQQGFLAYAVLLLVERGLPLKTAAALLGLSQVLAVLARIVIGHVSDRWVSPRLMLAVYGLAMGPAFIGLAALPRAPSMLLAGAVMGAVAVTAMGWPGLMTAQLLRLAPPGSIARCASGNQVFTFAGAVLGPLLLAALQACGVSYALACGALAALALCAGVAMLIPTSGSPSA